MTTSVPIRQDRPNPAKVALCAPSCSMAAVAIALGVYYAPYAAAQMGVSLAAVGAIFGLVRLLDVPFDPFLGMIMDRTKTPIGRYRPWILIGAPVLMLAIYMLFDPPAGMSEGYLLTWLLVFYMGTSTAAWRPHPGRPLSPRPMMLLQARHHGRRGRFGSPPWAFRCSSSTSARPSTPPAPWAGGASR